MDAIQLSRLDHHFADFVTRIEGRSCEGLWIAAALVEEVEKSVHLFLSSATENEKRILLKLLRILVR